MQEQEASQQLQAQVKDAYDTGTPLCIHGSGSKDFYGRVPSGERLDVSTHCGIVNYEPTELVITARAGTPLHIIEASLAEQQQMLAFEPPYFAGTATLGGTIACNLSGPRRAYAGAARDFVLGAQILNGKGEILRFGGEVMKNVAGYDASRLMCGSLGTLGVLLEVSLKVLPVAHKEITLIRETTPTNALEMLHTWAQQPWPISASCYHDNLLYIRLSGAKNAVEAAHHQLGGDLYSDGLSFWRGVREQRLGFFKQGTTLWRLSLASDMPPLDLDGEWLFEWGGAQRWLISDATAATIRTAAANAGGHATRFRSHERNDFFHPLPDGLMAVHRNLKHAFDPGGILNSGRMYEGL